MESRPGPVLMTSLGHLGFIWVHLYQRSSDTLIPPSDLPSADPQAPFIFPLDPGAPLLHHCWLLLSQEALLMAFLSHVKLPFPGFVGQYWKGNVWQIHMKVEPIHFYITFCDSVCIFKMTAWTEQCLDQKEWSINCGMKTTCQGDKALFKQKVGGCWNSGQSTFCLSVQFLSWKPEHVGSLPHWPSQVWPVSKREIPEEMSSPPFSTVLS